MIFTYGSLTVHTDVKFKTSKTEKHRNTHLSIQLHSITNLSERCHIIQSLGANKGSKSGNLRSFFCFSFVRNSLIMVRVDTGMALLLYWLYQTLNSILSSTEMVIRKTRQEKKVTRKQGASLNYVHHFLDHPSLLYPPVRFSVEFLQNTTQLNRGSKMNLSLD